MKSIFEELKSLSPEQRNKLKSRLKEKGMTGAGIETINPAPEQEYYPLSSAQKRMYTMFQVDPASTVYNMPVVLLLKGEPDRDRLENAFRQLIRRHESFRTSFHLVGEQLVQRIATNVDFTIDYVNGGTLQHDSPEVEKMIRDFVRPFDFSRAPIFRVKLIRLMQGDEVVHLLLQDKHHIISDGISEEIINRDLAMLYAGEELKPLGLQYKDFAVWQQEQLEKEWFREKRNYWLNRFTGELPVLNLPTDFTRPKFKSLKGDYLSFALDKQLTGRLKQLASDHTTTLYILLFSIFKTLLYRYSHEKDLVIASDTANRTRAELQGIVGMFINKLVIRTNPDDELSFAEYLQQVNSIFMAALENQEYQFDMLVQDLNVPRDTSRNPIFDISMGFQNMDKAETGISDLQIGAYDQANLQVSRLDLHLDGFEAGDELHFTFEYSTDLFRRDTIVRMAGHFAQIAHTVAADPGVPLGAINMLSAKEKEYLLKEISGGSLDYETNKTTHGIFEQQVVAFPGKPAVTDGDRVLTYAELNAKANQLATVLRQKNVQPDQPVVLLVDRSLEMIIGMLGVLKAGACYVPVDCNYPSERIQFMLNDCGARIVLATMNEALMNLAGDPSFSNIDWILLDDDSLFEGNAENLPLVNQPGNLAYIIYTSATTGTSKGVMLEHRGLLNLVANTQKLFHVDDKDHVLQFATLSFDASVFEVFTALLSGATLHIVPAAVINDYNLFEKYINEQEVSFALLPPTYAQHLNPDAIHTLRVLITGGSASSFELAKKWQHRLMYVNAYGPTEITVVASYFICGADTDLASQYCSVPIGRPLDNTQVYILDEQLQPVPAGVAGELCVAGDGVSRGYCNQEALTAERFVINPFGNGKMYRTGDLACWTHDGQLEFRGRKDDQVKIRGFRIEPGEIEKVLQEHSGIKEAVVIAAADNSNPGEKILCAYYVKRQQDDLPVNEVKRHLEKSLPAYMIPPFIFRLDALPLTPNGKVDKKKLPLPGENENDAAVSQQPVSAFEKDLAAIWQAVLKKDAVGVNDNFFTLGGDSIKAITLVSQLNKQMGLKLVINNIFANQTIGSLAKFIREQKKDAGDIPAVAEAEKALLQWKEQHSISYAGELLPGYEDIYPVSDIQSGMFFHNLLNPQLYHNQIVFEIDEAFDYPAFRATIRLLAEKHSIFRCSFHTNSSGMSAMAVHPFENMEEKVFYHDFSGLSPDEQKAALENFMEDDIAKGFDFTLPGLWRMIVFKLAADHHAVLLACHHAIMDGWSDAVFLTEISQVYQKLKNGERFVPVPLKCSYRDFIADQWRYKQSPSVKQYWRNLLQGYERLPLPLVKQGSAFESVKKEHFHLLIPDGLRRQMEDFAKDNELSLKHICLAAYTCLLQLTTGKNDITIGVLSHGRPELEDSENMLGCFLNTVPFRVQFDKILYAREILDMVRQSVNGQQGYDKLSLTDILQATGEKTTEQNPIFDVFFGYLNFHVYEQAASGMKPGAISKGFGLNNTLFDLIVEFYDELMISFHYDGSLYAADEVHRISHYYVRILERLVSYPMEVVRTTDIMPREEVNQLLVDFNATTVQYPGEATVVSLFEQQVVLTPGKTAVCSNGTQLTYSELNSRANQLASLLRKKGIHADEPVALLAERSIDMVIAMLGILKAGGCYVPVDASYPAERILLMINECNARIVIAGETVSVPEEIRAEVIDPSGELLQTEPDINLPLVNTASDLAYIMYTSGTTGRPKGTMIGHKSIIRLVRQPNYITLDEQTKILLTGSVSFDATTFEVWGALLNSGELHLLSQDQLMDTRELKKYIATCSVNTMWFTSSWFNQLADADPQLFNGLRFLLVGGEKLSPAHIAKVQRANPDLQIINGYGPTENTTFSVCFPLQQEFVSDIPLGYPINNTKVFILNTQRQLLPVGVPGEIYLAGDGLARGYYQQPDLSLEKFVTLYLDSPQRAYASGDMGRWLPDGTIGFTGRIDEQLKIRGYRIEPAEIEQALLGYPAIDTALVDARKDEQGHKFLVAYVVVADEQVPATVEIRKYLQGRLPDYMIPAHFVVLDKLPLTINGKVDRSALPEPVLKADNPYQPPRDETEIALAEIWQQVLDLPVIGIHDNFFELGGHSLKALLAISSIGREMDVTVTLRDIFKHPTIELLAEEIRRKQWLQAQASPEPETASLNVIEL